MKTVKQVESRVRQLTEHGQSIWLDFIRRSFVRDGGLKQLVDEDGLRGVTSNPSIFEKAIGGSDDYTEQLQELANDSTLSPNTIYERLAVEDIRAACDILRPVYEETKGRDGYVSMEVSPLLASDSQATVDEARRLWQWIDRPNLMVKVPGTKEGIPAIRTLISEGMNINVTLLFSREAYRSAAEAYMEGLEELSTRTGDLSNVASVASFFVSRIDSSVDKHLKEKAGSAESDKEKSRAENLRGKAAIANAKLAYEIYRQLFTSERWKALVEKGARPQRLLWASTSTKDPAFPDTLYVDELIGNETVNTVPMETLEAFRDHGNLADTLEAGLEDAKEVFASLERLGISFDAITDELLEDGVEKFAASFRTLLEAIRLKRLELATPLSESMTYSLPESLSKAVKETVKEWTDNQTVSRLWSKDSSLWTNTDEGNWLDWLTIVDEQLKDTKPFQHLQKELKADPFKHVLLLGMGGSSLCPEVMAKTFGKQKGYPTLEVLDSTNPAQVFARRDLNLADTLYIVASKSGTTLEPNIFMLYFMDEVAKVLGKDAVGKHFVAITDPGSKLEKFANENKFRHIYHGVPAIGGRYSALSNFGMIPSAAMGLDVERLLDGAHTMALACKSNNVLDNPGALLGIILGASAKGGRDKLTILTSAGISDLGAWLEQLIAESTGKDGKAIIPVDREMLGTPGAYGSDRLFVYVRLDEERDGKMEGALAALESQGHPVVRITMNDRYQIAQEFFRWEIACAVAGSIININPFNQPDVEASKIASRALTETFESEGKLPEEKAFFEESGIKLYSNSANRDQLESIVRSKEEDASVPAFLAAHLSRIEAGDYLAVLAYLDMTEENERLLQNIRHAIRDSRKIATCLGFGPRFLHSTGQAYKGGPNSGVFIQITSDHARDIQVPDHKYTFGVVVDCQARGDLEVLESRSRRVLRIHLGADVKAGLKRVQESISQACSK